MFVRFALFFRMDVMEDIIKLIKNAKSAVILPHISADGDAIGSCQAMRCVLSDMGINAVIYAEETVEERLYFIANGVRVYNGDTIDYDTCIVLDCGDEDRLGTRKELLSMAKTVINIDHHRTNTGFGDASLVVSDASATGEVLYNLFRTMGVTLNSDIAGYLYTAICSDTGGFAYSNVSQDTFKIASELVSHNIKHWEISRLLFDCVDMKSELLKAELTKDIRSYYGGKVRTVVISREFADKFNVDPKELEGLVDLPRRIRGTEIAVALKELDDKIRISLRSNGDSDVSEIALKFGGGGHIKAAGCSILDVTIDEAEKMVVDACEGAI